MKKTQEGKGITLISLVITIVVLLILAGVAISITVDEDGLFGKATKASKETQIAKDNEALQFAILGSYMDEELLLEEWNITEQNGKITAVSPAGNVFEVDENKKITYIEGNGGGEVLPAGVSMELAKYLLGQDLQGRDLFDIIVAEEVDGEMNFTFKQDPTDTESTIYETVYYMTDQYDDETGAISLVIMYEGDTYQFEIAEGASGVNTVKGSIQRLTNTPTELKEYVLGKDFKGRNAGDIFSPGYGILLPDPDNPDSVIPELAKFALYDGTNIIYNRDVYTIIPDENGLTKAVVKTSTLEGNIGKYVKYKDLLWVVIREDSNNIELISADAIGDVTLGGETYEEARDSYNNAVTILNDACKQITGITTNIRNVGGPAEDKTTMQNTYDFSEIFSAEVTEGISFEQYEGETNGIKVSDDEYSEETRLLFTLGLYVPDNRETYWLSSRWPAQASSDGNVEYVKPGVRYAIGGDTMFLELLEVRVRNDVITTSGTARTLHVRPVITLDANVLDNHTETGKNKTEPINLD